MLILNFNFGIIAFYYTFYIDVFIKIIFKIQL